MEVGVGFDGSYAIVSVGADAKVVMRSNVVASTAIRSKTGDDARTPSGEASDVWCTATIVPCATAPGANVTVAPPSGVVTVPPAGVTSTPPAGGARGRV